MRIGIINFLAILEVSSLAAYLGLGRADFLDAPSNSWWGPIRVGCLLLNVACTLALPPLLFFWNRELEDRPATFRVVATICTVNVLLIIAFTIGLLLFLSPPPGA